MPLKTAVAFLDFAFGREEDDRIFFRWASNPFVDVSFEDYKNALKPRSSKPDKEVMQDVESIMTSYDRERGISK